ncbi:serine/threonine protein kinase [Streptomyces sp. 2132.2]|uniref:protein kinase n=1 Tax=Streptomyces sp. 2132.2 TaxID=2485161 RepID=UPI000F493A64|nr:protein kinase [Streptomyces sp. 2132.2]ROQ96330.1 serine/threonine protein kinase [Streptomyces sp. 2132.2]
MEDYAGRILAGRYRLPLPPSDAYELVETRAFDTRSGQEVLVRQVPLPEVVDAELLDGETPDDGGTRPAVAAGRRAAGDLPAVRRAIAAAQAAASVPDHPRLDQVFDVFAEGGSLWIVSELVPARPLAALIAEEPLSPYRAAEVAADVLTALRVLHAHGWTHRNITVRTVLICDDGRVVLTGLAAGAAEDALCGYDPVPRESAPHAQTWDAPEPPAAPLGWGTAPGPGGARDRSAQLAVEPDPRAGDAGPGTGDVPDAEVPPGAGRGSGGYAPLVAPGYDTGPRYSDHITPRPAGERADLKAAARAGAIAAYRAGAQAAAARVTEQRKGGSEPAPEPRPQGSKLPQGYSYPYGGPDGAANAAWHGATPRRQAALPPAESAESAGPAGPVQEPQPVPEPEPRPGPASAPGRAALPAPLALPEGYRQAEAPDPTAYLRPGQPGQPGQAVPRPGRARQPGPGGPDAYGLPGPPRPYGAEGPSMASYLPSGEPARPEPDGSDTPDTGAYPTDRADTGGGGAPDTGAYPGPARPAVRSTPSTPFTPSAQPARPEPPVAGADGGWGGLRGLGAERARLTRMTVVGAVTERWAPEQAGSVTGPWQLAAPIGPATDLWGLGALLYRAVQGHAPYPEDSVTELVDMVCAESPAFAEECGPLRPIVESLLRQDPTERPDFEELRGWLRSLVRSAPEPDGGLAALPMPEPDPARLPVVRRRGDLHGRHRNPAASRKPRSLGRSLLLGVLVLLAGAVAYALLFLPRESGQEPAAVAKTPTRAASAPAPASPKESPKPSAGQTPAAPAPAPPGYTTQQDPEHFEVAVPNGWERRGMNEAGQVRYTDGEYVLTVVPGRDKVEGNPDPATYQKDKEPELAPYRSSTWASGGDVKTTKVGNQLRVTGRYTWIDGNGRSVVARNFVVALGGSYHVVMVTGPQDGEGKVTEVFEKATGSYKSGG